MKLGDAAFNVDEFVAKLVSFMGGRHRFDGDSERARDEEHMDWVALGRMASHICRRPPTMGFMLGPLSVEKKERKVTRRQVEKRGDVELIRPQEVSSLSTVLSFLVERRRYSETGECDVSYGPVGGRSSPKEVTYQSLRVRH